MNPTQLRKLGLPDDAIPDAIRALQTAISSGALNSKHVKALLAEIIADPAAHTGHEHFGVVSQRLLEPQAAPLTPIPYRTWGSEIDQAAHVQMKQACSLPMAVGGALMPDAHVGYGLPIGGVLALENAVVPYAVGADIACRMKLSVLDIAPAEMDNRYERFRAALENGTRFGVGGTHETPQDHPVMDADWTVTRVTRDHKDKARKQLGTSGSGNHFVEFGVLTVTERDEQLGLDAGSYTALLSHSGSRGVGSSVCDVYSRMAQARLPKKYQELGRLAWLDLDDDAGREYWAAMNLMGDYAAANHAVIHRLVTKLLGARVVTDVENHHNFAWKEIHHGKEVIVHRKGATPAAAGVLGIIPGSMASPAFVVKEKDHPESFASASHGAGRCMSRTAARDKYNFRAVQKDLLAKGVRVISAGSDEVPYVYKDILKVMAEQTDLVETIARFDPKIVKMSDDGRAED